MPKEFSRTRRVGEQIQRDLSHLIHERLRDPRLGMVTVQAVDVSRDLQNARVYITVMDAGQRDSTLEALRHAEGFLRRELGRRMSIRVIPHLRFVYDESIERGARLSSLIDEVVAQDRAAHPSDDDGSEEQ